MIPFSKEIYIETEDFKEDPPKKFFRLSPGKEIRLKHAYYIKCTKVVKDKKTGNIIQVHCTYDPETRGGWSDDGRKVRGTSHWVSAKHAIKIEVRLYDRLFTDENPGVNPENRDLKDLVNPDSLKILDNVMAEPGLKAASPGEYYQFLRQGYFCVDSVLSGKKKIVFNRTVSLRDSWAKIEKKISRG
jgi:glutaminyl-tRNA synthetase